MKTIPAAKILFEPVSLVVKISAENFGEIFRKKTPLIFRLDKLFRQIRFEIIDLKNTMKSADTAIRECFIWKIDFEYKMKTKKNNFGGFVLKPNIHTVELILKNTDSTIMADTAWPE